MENFSQRQCRKKQIPIWRKCNDGGDEFFILAILIEIKVIELYKKNCWDVITLLMILTSASVIIFFGESIKKIMSINLLLLFILLQGVYVGLRCYLKNQLDTKLY